MGPGLFADPAVADGLAGNGFKPLERAAALGGDAVAARAAAEAWVGAEVFGHSTAVGNAASGRAVDHAGPRLAGSAGNWGAMRLEGAASVLAQAGSRRRRGLLAGAAGLRLDTARRHAGIIPAAVGIRSARDDRKMVAPGEGWRLCRRGRWCGPRRGRGHRRKPRRRCWRREGRFRIEHGRGEQISSLASGTGQQQAQQRATGPRRLSVSSWDGTLRLHGLLSVAESRPASSRRLRCPRQDWSRDLGPVLPLIAEGRKSSGPVGTCAALRCDAGESGTVGLRRGRMGCRCWMQSFGGEK